jgi:quercetin dioxygenase-like cupin family protein
MMEHVHCLDTNKMEWQDLEKRSGLLTKMLTSDPETGARTALQCIDPGRGYKAPTRPHYHSAEEEIILVKGAFTFNGREWLKRMSYCFHPPRTVHGFESAVDGETWFLSRVRKPLDYGFTDDKRDLVPYSLDDVTHERDTSVIVNAEAGDWQELRDETGKTVARRLVLSEHPRTKEGASLWEFLPGWESSHGDHYHDVFTEFFVFDGELLGSDGTVYSGGCYSYKPPRTIQPALSSPKGALIYMVTGGQLSFRPASELAELQSA